MDFFNSPLQDLSTETVVDLKKAFSNRLAELFDELAVRHRNMATKLDGRARANAQRTAARYSEGAKNARILSSI